MKRVLASLAVFGTAAFIALPAVASARPIPKPPPPAPRVVFKGPAPMVVRAPKGAVTALYG
jgi:hypothetical protein